MVTAPREEPLAIGCLRILLAYALVVAVLAATRVALSGSYWSEVLPPAALGALPALVGLAYWWEIRGVFQDRRLVRRALRGDAMRDGQRTAVVGSIEPLEEPLRSPFTHRPCVAYWYDVSKPTGSRHVSARRRFWGWHEAPASVNGDRGSVRLLGYFPEPVWGEALTHDQAFENAAAYLKATRPSVTLDLNTLPPTVQVDDPASVRCDIARAEPGLELRRLTLREYALEPGAIVCAIGRYSKAAGGLLRDRQRSVNGLELLVGQPAEVLRDLGRRATGRLLFGGLFAGIGLMVAMLAGT